MTLIAAVQSPLVIAKPSDCHKDRLRRTSQAPAHHRLAWLPQVSLPISAIPDQLPVLWLHKPVPLLVVPSASAIPVAGHTCSNIRLQQTAPASKKHLVLSGRQCARSFLWRNASRIASISSGEHFERSLSSDAVLLTFPIGLAKEMSIYVCALAYGWCIKIHSSTII